MIGRAEKNITLYKNEKRSFYNEVFFTFASFLWIIKVI